MTGEKPWVGVGEFLVKNEKIPDPLPLFGGVLRGDVDEVEVADFCREPIGLTGSERASIGFDDSFFGEGIMPSATGADSPWNQSTIRSGLVLLSDRVPALSDFRLGMKDHFSFSFEGESSGELGGERSKFILAGPENRDEDRLVAGLDST